jgi:hypothetical protein
MSDAYLCARACAGCAAGPALLVAARKVAASLHSLLFSTSQSRLSSLSQAVDVVLPIQATVSGMYISEQHWCVGRMTTTPILQCTCRPIMRIAPTKMPRYVVCCVCVCWLAITTLHAYSRMCLPTSPTRRASHRSSTRSLDHSFIHICLFCLIK